MDKSCLLFIVGFSIIGSGGFFMLKTQKISEETHLKFAEENLPHEIIEVIKTIDNGYYNPTELANKLKEEIGEENFKKHKEIIYEKTHDFGFMVIGIILGVFGFGINVIAFKTPIKSRRY